MGSIFGNNLKISLFGESHSPVMGITIDNLQPGVLVDLDNIKSELLKRRPQGDISTPRVETDQFEIVSGLFNGYTTGAPLTILIYNQNIKTKDYDELKSVVRPSHADYAAFHKYLGYNDYRGGGHFSGRLTAPIVAAGAICKQILLSKDIQIITHIKSIGTIEDSNLLDVEVTKDLITSLDTNFPVINFEAKKSMQDEILNAKASNDSIGGSVQVLITGIKVGVGNPVFHSLESIISHAMFSIGGVKAIEFGKGIEMSCGYGSIYNDQMTIVDGVEKFVTNNNGGINGGISNGNSICFTVYFKPTPTIGKPLQTIDVNKSKSVTLNAKGRHDPCFVHRACHVVTNLCAVTILDIISGSNYEG